MQNVREEHGRDKEPGIIGLLLLKLRRETEPRARCRHAGEEITGELMRNSSHDARLTRLACAIYMCVIFEVLILLLVLFACRM
jgi:hypothetical protein